MTSSNSNNNQYDPQLLYKQFIAYIKKQQKKPVNSDIQKQYKIIYSELHKNNHCKKNKLLAVSNREVNMRISGCKFTRIQGITELHTMQDGFIKCQSRIAEEVDKNQLEDQILMEESQQVLLQQEIDNYKKQISLKHKKIKQIKQQIKVLDLQQKKFAEAYHLANNIMLFTDQFSIVNNRNYNKMLQQQQQIVMKLKKMRIKAKNQLAQTKFQFQSQKNQHDIKCKKLMKTCIPLMQQDQKKIEKMTKAERKFMQYVGKVLVILQQSQSNYQTIKQQQCTKLASKKLNIDLLPIERVQFMNQVQKFQKKFQIRVESSDKIITKLYKQIKQKNQQIQKRIFQLNQQAQQYQKQFQQISYTKLFGQQYYQLNKLQNNQKQLQKNMQIIRNNSIMFVQIIQVINSLLVKFRYIFKLFIMMNIDKRKLSDHLLKLDQILDIKSKSGYQLTQNIINNNYIQTLLTQDTNLTELTQILCNSFNSISSTQIQNLLFLYFNDMRFALICKKNMIVQQLQQCNTKNMEEVVKILQTIRDQCEYNYNQKLKISFKILLDCLKSSTKNNINLNSSRSYIATPNQNKNNLLISQLYLPAGMFFKKIKQQTIDNNDQLIDDNHNKTQSKMENSHNADKDKPEQWGKQEKKNPSAMIRKLLAIRNQSTKHLKLLDLHECQKKYLKNDIYITQHHIPEFPSMKKTSTNQTKQNQQIIISNNIFQSHHNQEKTRLFKSRIQQKVKISPNEQIDHFLCRS